MKRILSCSAVFGLFDEQETQTVPNICSSANSAYLIMHIGGIVTVQDTRLYHPSKQNMSCKRKTKTSKENQEELFPPNWAAILHLMRWCDY